MRSCNTNKPKARTQTVDSPILPRGQSQTNVAGFHPARLGHARCYWSEWAAGFEFDWFSRAACAQKYLNLVALFLNGRKAAVTDRAQRERTVREIEINTYINKYTNKQR